MSEVQSAECLKKGCLGGHSGVAFVVVGWHFLGGRSYRGQGAGMLKEIRALLPITGKQKYLLPVWTLSLSLSSGHPFCIHISPIHLSLSLPPPRQSLEQSYFLNPFILQHVTVGSSHVPYKQGKCHLTVIACKAQGWWQDRRPISWPNIGCLKLWQSLKGDFIIFIPHRRNLEVIDVMVLLGMNILINSKGKICTQTSELC